MPPIRLWDKGVPNQASLKIMIRNSRMPESLAADLDAECAACLMGAARLSDVFKRYGRATVEASFDAILDKTTETYRREILARIPDGEYVWEDRDPPGSTPGRTRYAAVRVPAAGGSACDPSSAGAAARR